MWPLHVNLFNLTQITKLGQLHISLGFFQKHKFLEYQKTEVLLRDIRMTFSIYAKHPPSINLT